MRFIQYIDALIGAGQHNSPAERQVGHQERMVDYQDIHIIQASSGLMKRAVLVLIKQRVTDMAIGTYRVPQLIIEWMGPTIPITRPIPLLIGIPELLIRLLLRRIWAEVQ